jgi:hypothetical protein
MNRYITGEAEEDILKYLAEWKTGRYGKKLTWPILAKAFGFSRQALNGNVVIKACFNDVKQTLKGADSEIEILKDISKENEQLKKQVKELEILIDGYQQKYLRWQYNAEARGITVEQLNIPVPPTIKEELRKRQEK